MTTPESASDKPSTAPVTRRGRDRCRRIREVAGDLFLAHGFEGVSVDDIIRRVGGSKTNIYSQFGSKEGLFVAVVETMCRDFIGDFNADDLGSVPVSQGLATLANRLVDVLLTERHIAFQRLMIAESGRFPIVAMTWFEHGPQKSRRVIADYLANRGAADGLPIDCERAALQFHDMITIDLLYRALLGHRPEQATIAATITAAIDTLLHGAYRRPTA